MKWKLSLNPKIIISAMKTVITALEKDAANDDYRRFKWALALLKSMKDDPENIKVMLFGH